MPIFKKALKLARIIVSRYYLRALIANGTAAGIEHSNLLSHLGQLRIRQVVDIGANRGQFALVARRSFPQARIVSFEPLSEPATIFRRVFESDPLVVLHQMAIGPEEGDTRIHVSRADDSSSLLPISDLQNTLFPGTAEKEVRLVQVRPLDAVLTSGVIQRPALLKIDVQGFERAVLEGCESLLPCFSYVYVECSFRELYKGQALAHEIICMLDTFGFSLSGVYNLSYDKRGVAIQGDFLFAR